MQPFIHDNFLLQNKTAKVLYHTNAKNMPIVDFHNHLNPKDIYEDKCYSNLTEVWLMGDHYKWRAMRAYGIPERLITGNGAPYDKFLAWAETIPNTIGNPLYHWTHMELKRYFGIDTILSPATAGEIWEACNARLKSPDYSVRNLLRMQNVETLFTTDDPVDDLEYHLRLREEGFEIQVLPTFRPERAIGIEKSGFLDYRKRLGQKTGRELSTVFDLIDALKQRLAYFVNAGCRAGDHSLENNLYSSAAPEEVNTIYQKRLAKEALTDLDYAKYHGFLIKELGREYNKYNLVMQLHVGALRNNSTRLFHTLGTDAGLDSLNDMNYAVSLSKLLDSMDVTNELPKTVLYYLNPKDADMLAAMAGNFQSNESGIKGKIQLGSAWWFCDHKPGMERQMEVLSYTGLLAAFIGMLTDSRSFLSFPRHEYFRRILCNKVGTWVEDGEYPCDMEYLGVLIKNICYYNSKNYFNS